MAHILETDIAAGSAVSTRSETEMAKKIPARGPGGGRESATAGVALARVVGNNLKRLRRRQGYSLERLAKRSGVSRAMLGQIETGRSVPTISLLSKIAAALDVSLPGLLMSPEAVATRVLKPENTRAMSSSDGGFVARALFPFGRERDVEFYEVTIAAGHDEAGEAHALGTRENLVVAAGAVEVQVGRERAVLLRKGDALLFAADQPHTYRNPGKEPATLYLVMIHPKNGH